MELELVPVQTAELTLETQEEKEQTKEKPPEVPNVQDKQDSAGTEGTQLPVATPSKASRGNAIFHQRDLTFVGWNYVKKYYKDQNRASEPVSGWGSLADESRQLYKEWVKDLYVDPHAAHVKEKEAQADDHPLSLAAHSVWNEFFKDKELLKEISKDVKRTLPNLHFFQNEISPGEKELHSDALWRILFVYAKLNPGICYVQGMNEVLAPIYYVFATDPDENVRKHAEADAFLCFKNIMSEIMNHFCKSLDQSEFGIVATMTRLNRLLSLADKELWEDMQEKGINPQFYSFRWITLLFTQEFELPDVLRLWDSFLADEKRFDFMMYFCVAMLENVREEIIQGSFADNLKLLQTYPSSDIHVLLNLAIGVRDKVCHLDIH